MRRKVTALLVSLAFAAAGVTAVAARPAAADSSQLPGMCSGRADPNLVVIAHANGRLAREAQKMILNVETDAAAHATGSLVFGQGPATLTATDWCRVWQHQEGQQSNGSCEEPYPTGALTAHAVGLGTQAGRTMLVRVDVRQLSDGQGLYRLRYRPWPPGEQVTAQEEDNCGDEGWTWYPAEEEWAPLSQVMIRTTAAP